MNLPSEIQEVVDKVTAVFPDSRVVSYEPPTKETKVLSNIQPFAEYVEKKKDILLKMRKFALQTGRNPNDLETVLAEGPAYYYHAREIFATAQYHLTLAKKLAYPPKESGTEAERTAMLNAAVAQEKLFCDLAEATVDALKEKISTTQTLVNAMKQEAKFSRTYE